MEEKWKKKARLLTGKNIRQQHEETLSLPSHSANCAHWHTSTNECVDAHVHIMCTGTCTNTHVHVHILITKC